MNTEFLIEQAAPGQERLVMKRGESRMLLCQHGGGMKDCLRAAQVRAAEAESERKRERKSPPVTAGSNLPQAAIPPYVKLKLRLKEPMLV